jgi:hypothetical protein
MRQAILLDRVLERARDVSLTDKIVKRLGSIFSGENFVAHKMTLNALRRGRK